MPENSRIILDFFPHPIRWPDICLFLKVKTAYVSVYTSCLGAIVHCFNFLFLHPLEMELPMNPPLPLPPSVGGEYGYFLEPHITLVYISGRVSVMELIKKYSAKSRVAQKRNYFLPVSNPSSFLCVNQFETSTSTPGQPPGNLNFKDWLGQFPTPLGQNRFQMPYP